MKFLSIMLVSIAVLFSILSSATAFEGPLKAVPIDLSREIKTLELEWGPMAVHQGEIYDVTKDCLNLRMNDDYMTKIALASTVRIYLNGRQATWFSLRPVTQDFYVIAHIWTDRDGNARLIEGRYEGESVRILAAAVLSNGRYCLVVKPMESENSASEVVETAIGCRGLPNPFPQVLRGEAFVLFDFDGRIRRVFLL